MVLQSLLLPTPRPKEKGTALLTSSAAAELITFVAGPGRFDGCFPCRGMMMSCAACGVIFHLIQIIRLCQEVKLFSLQYLRERAELCSWLKISSWWLIVITLCIQLLYCKKIKKLITNLNWNIMGSSAIASHVFCLIYLRSER